jgi:hypothetical protein
MRATWNTPTATERGEGNRLNELVVTGQGAASDVRNHIPGPARSSFNAQTESSAGRPKLNPAFSGWLMAFPPEWDEAAKRIVSPPSRAKHRTERAGSKVTATQFAPQRRPSSSRRSLTLRHPELSETTKMTVHLDELPAAVRTRVLAQIAEETAGQLRDTVPKSPDEHSVEELQDICYGSLISFGQAAKAAKKTAAERLDIRENLRPWLSALRSKLSRQGARDGVDGWQSWFEQHKKEFGISLRTANRICGDVPAKKDRPVTLRLGQQVMFDGRLFIVGVAAVGRETVPVLTLAQAKSAA